MSRIICDQLVKCMKEHNRNVFARKVDAENENTMRACVDVLLKSGRVPVVTVQNMGTMRQYKYNVCESKMLSECWAKMPYAQLSFVDSDTSKIETYADIEIPRCTMGYCMN